MAHRRKELRDLVVGYLTGLATTGTSVYKNRVYTHMELPSLNVLMTNEVVDNDLRTRRLEVTIQARAKVTSALEEVLDQIADEVELVMDANYTLDGNCAVTFLTSTEIEIEGEADQPVGLMSMNYTVVYNYAPT